MEGKPPNCFKPVLTPGGEKHLELDRTLMAVIVSVDSRVVAGCWPLFCSGGFQSPFLVVCTHKTPVPLADFISAKPTVGYA